MKGLVSGGGILEHLGGYVLLSISMCWRCTGLVRSSCSLGSDHHQRLSQVPPPNPTFLSFIPSSQLHTQYMNSHLHHHISKTHSHPATLAVSYRILQLLSIVIGSRRRPFTGNSNTAPDPNPFAWDQTASATFHL